MKMMLPLLLILLLILVGASLAQETSCPALVEQAISMVGESCAGIGRNQICYGHNNVKATTSDDEPLSDFETSGDIASILDVTSVATAPLIPDEETWGVAVLALQVNLPDTLPGQNVTFIVFGDTQLEAETNLPDMVTLDATISTGANLRTGPGTEFTIAGSTASGDTLTIIGRNPTGDWLRVEDDFETWIFAELVSLGGDLDDLSIVDYGEGIAAYNAPLQAFRMTTGVNETQCVEAPQDGLLVQAPLNTTVNFLINGIDVKIGSRLFLRAETNTQLEVTTLEGTVTVTSGGESQTVEPGTTAVFTEGEPPQAAQESPDETVSALPINLLPELTEETGSEDSTPQAPSSGDSGASATGLTFTVPGNAGWVDSGVALNAGQSFTLSASGSVNLWPLCQDLCGPETPELDCARLCPAVITRPSGSELVQGFLYNASAFPVTSGRLGSLVAGVGSGQAFEVGVGGTFTANNSGTLQFHVNEDPAFVGDESGSFVVQISVVG